MSDGITQQSIHTRLPETLPSALNVELHEHIVLTTHSPRSWGYRMVHYELRS